MWRNPVHNVPGPQVPITPGGKPITPAASTWATTDPTQDKPGATREVDVKDGEEGIARLVARDVEVSKAVFGAHAAWYREQAVEQGVAEPQPRWSIFFMPLFSPYHPVAASWSAFMILVDFIYTAFWVPLGVAFCTEDFGSPHTRCTTADLIGGSIYLANLFMGFQTGLVLRHNYKRTKVLDGMRVARYYILYSRFWLDLLAVVPFIYLIVILGIPGVDEDQSSTSWVGILSLIRLVRFLRLVSLSKVVITNTLSGRYQDLLAKHVSITTLYTIMLIYFLAVVINLEACILLLIAFLEGPENSWLTSVSWEDFTSVSEMYQWYAAVYWVITTSTTTGYGDFFPHSVTEQVFANLYMIAGMVVFGLLVGTIANALTRASATAAELYRFRKKMAAIGVWLTQHHIHDKLQKQVKDYFSDVWVSRDEMSLDTEIFSDLPTHLRAKLSKYITMDTVIKVHLFRDQEPGLQELVAAALRPVDIIPGHDICRQGEEGDRMWLCSDGELQALQHQAEPSYPSTPCLLGESVLLGEEMPAFRLRPFTIRASRGVVKIWELRLSDFWPIVRMYPQVKEDLLAYIRSHLLHEMGFKDLGASATMDSSWCESVASISSALLKQSASVLETAAAELQSAQLEDGSLTTLLDGLMEFSTIRTKRVTLLQHGVGKQSDSMLDAMNITSNSNISTATPGGALVLQGTQARSLGRRVPSGSGEMVTIMPPTGQHQGGGNHRSSQGQITVFSHGNGAMAACMACGRSVCGTCRQVLKPLPGDLGANGSMTSVTPFLGGTDAASNAPRPISALLVSMGVQSGFRQGWRSMSRVSTLTPATRSGMSTVSMAVKSHNNLAAPSLPTENFGQGYGLWG